MLSALEAPILWGDNRQVPGILQFTVSRVSAGGVCRRRLQPRGWGVTSTEVGKGSNEKRGERQEAAIQMALQKKMKGPFRQGDKRQKFQRVRLPLSLASRHALLTP